MIFDKKIIEFLKRNENHKSHLCSRDNSKMTFDAKHGFYVCKKNKIHIKAPQILIGVGNKPVKLYWTNCPDCQFTNVTDESQEQFLYRGQGENGNQIFEQNEKQEKIQCTNCDVVFEKKLVEKKKKVKKDE